MKKKIDCPHLVSYYLLLMTYEIVDVQFCDTVTTTRKLFLSTTEQFFHQFSLFESAAENQNYFINRVIIVHFMKVYLY